MQFDYDAHNAEVKEVWDAYRKRDPIRVPCNIAMNIRMILLDPKQNVDGVRFYDYMHDPEVMLRQQLRFQEMIRTEMVFDHEMGLPDAWPIHIDYQNVYEAAYFGTEVHYPENNCPCTHEWLHDDNKWEILDRGVPEPIDDEATGGWMKRSWEFYEYWCGLRDKGFEYRGRPIEPNPCGENTDGPFTVAMNLRGGNVCIDLLDDPEYFHALLSLITESIIVRIRALRRKGGRPPKSKEWGFADDSIILLSNAQFTEFVLPYHKRLIAELVEGERPLIGMHLCGDAQRYFPLLTRELNVQNYDTGFPIDFTTLRQELGTGVEIAGGPTVDTLCQGPVETIKAETKRILGSGVMEGGRFIIKEANNLSPCTPPNHVRAFYEAAKRYGQY